MNESKPFLLPNYSNPAGDAGTTIANIPATVAQLLGVPFQGLPPLPAELWHPLTAAGPIKRVVLLIIDGMGQNLLDVIRPEIAPILERAAMAETITSVFPSTTVNALACLWTGHAPAQHGLVGLNLYLPEFQTVGQMIHFTPKFDRMPDALVKGGVNPKRFLAVPGFGEQLTPAGVTSHTLKHYTFTNSALSQMHNRGITHQRGTFTFTDTLRQIREILETDTENPVYVGAYWETIDTMSHVYGHFHPHVQAELVLGWQQIEQILLDGLSAKARAETLICVVADHGQTAIPQAQRIDAAGFPHLQEQILMTTGEPRAPYFYTRPAALPEVLAYLQQEYNQQMWSLTSAEALAMGLWGPAPYAPQTTTRVGDVVSICRNGYCWVRPEDTPILNRFHSTHGSLTPAEMVVPWLVFRP